MCYFLALGGLDKITAPLNIMEMLDLAFAMGIADGKGRNQQAQ